MTMSKSSRGPTYCRKSRSCAAVPAQTKFGYVEGVKVIVHSQSRDIGTRLGLNQLRT